MKNISFALIALFVVVFSLNSGCKKQEPPQGIITVVDQDNLPVWQAEVFLHAYDVPPPGRPGDSIVVRKGVTDVNGKFSFEVENPCVLTIEAMLPRTFTDSATGAITRDTIFGTASIRLEMDEVSEQKVIVRP